MNEIRRTIVNGWMITTRLFRTDSEYHIARKDNRVHTSTDINYLTRLYKERN